MTSPHPYIVFIKCVDQLQKLEKDDFQKVWEALRLHFKSVVCVLPRGIDAKKGSS